MAPIDRPRFSLFARLAHRQAPAVESEPHQERRCCRGVVLGDRGRARRRYEISLRRWPVEADKGINDGTYGKAFNYKQARLRIGDVDETKDIPEGAKEVTFRVTLSKGVTQLARSSSGPS